MSIRYVPSEAAAGLILKTKTAALRDGDRIIGVVKSTDVKHDGRSQGLVAPNVKAQIAMQISLLEKAQLTPAQIECVLSFSSLVILRSNSSFRAPASSRRTERVLRSAISSKFRASTKSSKARTALKSL